MDKLYSLALLGAVQWISFIHVCSGQETMNCKNDPYTFDDLMVFDNISPLQISSTNPKSNVRKALAGSGKNFKTRKGHFLIRMGNTHGIGPNFEVVKLCLTVKKVSKVIIKISPGGGITQFPISNPRKFTKVCWNRTRPEPIELVAIAFEKITKKFRVKAMFMEYCREIIE